MEPTHCNQKIALTPGEIWFLPKVQGSGGDRVMKTDFFLRALAVGASAAAFCALSFGAKAAPTVLNGSFEVNASSIPSGGFTTVFAGQTTISDWAVVSGSVDWVGTYWQAENGIASIDLSGDSAGKISQEITGLTIGDQYEISFWLAGNPDGGPGIQTGAIKVSAGPAGYNFAYDVTNQTHADMGWIPESSTLRLRQRTRFCSLPAARTLPTVR